MRFTITWNVLLLIGVMVLPEAAFAYVGPGAGLSFLGVLIASIGALLLAVVGFIWYPVKRLLRGRKVSTKGESGNESR